MAMSFFSKHWHILLIILAIIIILVSVVLRLITPQQTPVTETPFINTNLDNTTTTFSNISYTGSNENVPNQLLLGKVTGIMPPEDVIDNLTQQYSLEPNEVGTAWTNNQEQMLTQNGVTQQYQLLLSQNEAITSNPKTLEELVATSQTTLIRLFPLIQVKPLTTNIQYYQSALETFDLVSFEEARVVIIPFSYYIETYPVFFDKNNDAVFSVVTNKAGEILSVSFFPEFLTIETLESHKALTIDEAINQINTQNKAAITSAYFEEVVPLDLSTITNGNLTTLSIEYRHDTTTSLVIPFYHFKGTADNQNGMSMEIDLITPAIETSP